MPAGQRQLVPPGGRGGDNDTAWCACATSPDFQFDLFTVQNSNQNADGSALAGFQIFGLTWYQSDIHANHAGSATVRIETILLGQISASTPPPACRRPTPSTSASGSTIPADAEPCGFTGFTPFNGEHHAGPVAITRPDA